MFLEIFFVLYSFDLLTMPFKNNPNLVFIEDVFSPEYSYNFFTNDKDEGIIS
jgi:hypothetical protein